MGVEGGYGWAKQNFNPAFDPFCDDLFSTCSFFGSILGVTDPTLGSVKQSGGVAGGFAGVQKQWGSLVLGAEVSVDWANIRGSDTLTNNQTFCLFGCSAGTLAPDTSSHLLLNVNQTQSMSAKIDELA